MSDSLKDRLTQHSQAFESLLSLIPAKYYYDEESSNQWKKKGARKTEDGKAEAKRNKKNKFDPETGSSALDELKRRERMADNADSQDSDASDSETKDVTVYDDNGNPITLEKELSVQEILQLKSIEKLKPGQFKLEPSISKLSTPEPLSVPQPDKNKPELSENSFSSQDDKSDADMDADMDSDSSHSAFQAETTPSSEEKKPVEKRKAEPNGPKPGIEELRAKLAAKVNEMKAMRKAPGSNAAGAPKNREELLAARKLKLEQKKSQKMKVKEMENPMNDDEDDDEDEDDENDQPSPELDLNLSFGQVRFKDGDRLAKDASNIEQQRKIKKRNAMDQLKVLESKKSKISKLDSEKQNEIAENAKWSRAILQSEGAKVRDDEKLLKKTIKQKENRKRKSEKEWDRRIYNTKKGISDREAKRDANIAAHREAKVLKLKGKKKRAHMKKAGSQFKAR